MRVFSQNRSRIVLISLGLALILAGVLILSVASISAAPPKDLTQGSNIFLPNAAGNATALTPTPASRANWDCVNDYPAVDTTDTVSNSGNTAAADLYNLADPAASSPQGAILNLSIYAYMEKISSGGSPQAKLTLRVGSTDYPGAAITLTSSWVLYHSDWATNPATSAAWTWADLTSLQAGLSLQKGACAQLYVQTNYVFTYKNSSHATPWGYGSNKYDDTSRTVYFYATNVADGNYHLNFYDGQSAPRGSFGIAASGGSLSYNYTFPKGLSSTQAGTWRVDIVKDSDNSVLAQQNFEVAASAIPEFPTILASILVPLGCVGVYFGLRKKTKPSQA